MTYNVFSGTLNPTHSPTHASSELAPNMFGASSELASVMEFGFNGFRVLVALVHSTLVVGVIQTLRRWIDGPTYIRQGGHHVVHWPTFLVELRFYVSLETNRSFRRLSYQSQFLGVVLKKLNLPQQKQTRKVKQFCILMNQEMMGW